MITRTVWEVIKNPIEKLNTFYKEINKSISKYNIRKQINVELVTVCEGEVSFTKSGTPIAQFSTSRLPGCCGVLVLHHVWVNANFRNKGIGARIIEIAEKMAKANDFGIIMCTSIEGNNFNRLLEKANWTQCNNFINPKTDNSVNFYIKNLN